MTLIILYQIYHQNRITSNSHISVTSASQRYTLGNKPAIPKHAMGAETNQHDEYERYTISGYRSKHRDATWNKKDDASNEVSTILTGHRKDDYGLEKYGENSRSDKLSSNLQR